MAIPHQLFTVGSNRLRIKYSKIVLMIVSLSIRNTSLLSAIKLWRWFTSLAPQETNNTNSNYLIQKANWICRWLMTAGQLGTQLVTWRQQLHNLHASQNSSHHLQLITVKLWTVLSWYWNLISFFVTHLLLLFLFLFEYEHS